MGEYKSGFASAAACTRCAIGVTTSGVASTSEAACSMVLTTVYPAAILNGTVTSTQKCPQGYYCLGGTPTAAFNTSSPDNITGTTVVKCPLQTWTENIGASAAAQCSELVLLVGFTHLSLAKTLT
jgi:hypothetical protein